MRLAEIKRSDADIENDLGDDPNYGKILVAEFKKKYPKVKITLNSNILETADGEFYFQADPAVDNGYYGIMMGDIKSGKYKGVVANIIVAVTKWIKPHAPKGYKPALFIDDDESGGVWDIIATKLKLRLIVVGEDDDFGNLDDNSDEDDITGTNGGPTFKGEIPDLFGNYGKDKKYWNSETGEFERKAESK